MLKNFSKRPSGAQELWHRVRCVFVFSRMFGCDPTRMVTVALHVTFRSLHSPVACFMHRLACIAFFFTHPPTRGEMCGCVC